MMAAFAGHAAANGKSTGQKRGATRRAITISCVKVGKAQTFRRHAIQVRRANARISVAAQIAVAHVVGENDDDIRRVSIDPLGKYENKQEKKEASDLN